MSMSDGKGRSLREKKKLKRSKRKRSLRVIAESRAGFKP
jgi:hypothetical protein